MQLSLQAIATLVNGVIVGESTTLITALSPIDQIAPGSLVFAEGGDNLKRAEQSSAAAILVGSQVTSLCKPVIQVDRPFKAFIELLKHIYPAQEQPKGIHPTAVIGAEVELGEHVSIGPYVVIESHASIGAHTVIKSHVHVGHHVRLGEQVTIHPHVTLYDHTQIGDRSVVHASSVIGSDGFGYTFEQGQHVKIPHVGQVLIGQDVEIGANTVVDRATLGATLIGDGTKVDNLVQIAHSVKLGKHNILCAFTGIAGSTTSGDNVIFAANVGVSDHVRIDDGVILGARAGVPPNKHLKQGNIYLGSPARPKEKAIEQELSMTRIPFMRKNIQALTQKVTLLAEQLTKEEKI